MVLATYPTCELPPAKLTLSVWSITMVGNARPLVLALTSDRLMSDLPANDSLRM